MSTIDSILTKLKSDTKYSTCDEDTLYDIAYNLYYKNSYQTLITYLNGALDHYLSSIFSGENSIWAEFTYTEIIGMEENGVLIPEEILEWAHSMADSDTTSYQTTSDDLTDSDLDTEIDDSIITLKKLAKTLIVECEDGESEITNKLEKLDILSKDASYAQGLAADTQKTALNRIQDLINEWKDLESKIKRGEQLSETEQTRYNELSGLLNQENETYTSDMNDINIDFEELAQSLNEINDMSEDTSDISLETQAVGTSLGGKEQEHKYTSTGTNQQPNMSLADMAAVSKNLGYITLITGQDTYMFTEEVLTTVNEVASIMNLTEEVTASAKDDVQDAGISDTGTDAVLETAVSNAESGANTSTASTNTTGTSASVPTASSVSAPTASTTATGTSSAESAMEVEAAAATDGTEETAADPTDDDLRTQTQEQIDACNSCSDAMTNALGILDPLKQEVEDIKAETALQKEAEQAELAKKMKEYEKLCDKIRNGDELTSAEKNKFKKLNKELDTENGKYIQDLDAKINTLNTYVSCLSSAFDIVSQSFDTANTTIETGKALAIQEYGDKSRWIGSWFFRILSEEQQKDFLYGKSGESLGRDAIDRGELLTQEATDTNTVLTAQIPLNKFAKKEAKELKEDRRNFVDKINEITDGIDTENEDSSSEKKKSYGPNDADVLELTAKSVAAIAEETGIKIENLKRRSKAKDNLAEAKAVIKEYERKAEEEEREKERQAEEAARLREKISEEEKKRYEAHSALKNSKNFGGVNDAGANENQINSSTNTINSCKERLENLQKTSERQQVTEQKKRITAANKLSKTLASNDKETEKADADSITTDDNKDLSELTMLLALELDVIGLGEMVAGIALMSNPWTFHAGLALYIIGVNSHNIGVVGLYTGAAAETVSLTAEGVVHKTKKSLGKAEDKLEDALDVVTDGLEETDTSTTTTTAVAATDSITVNAGSKNSLYGTSSSTSANAASGSSSTGAASKTDTASTAAASGTTAAADTSTSDTEVSATEETAEDDTESTDEIVTYQAKEEDKTEEPASDDEFNTVYTQGFAARAQGYINANKESRGKIENEITGAANSTSAKASGLDTAADDGETVADAAISLGNSAHPDYLSSLAEETVSQGEKTNTAVQEGNDASSKLADSTKTNTAASTTTASSSTASSAKSSSSSSSSSENTVDAKSETNNCAQYTEESKKGASDSKENTREINNVSKDAENTDKEMKKSSKELDKSIKKDEKKVKENEKKTNETVKKIDEENTAIETAQLEIETLTTQDEADSANAANNAPAQDPNDPAAGTMGAAAGSAAGGSSEGKNSAKIQELSTQVQQRSTKLNLYSRKLIKFQTQSDTLVKRMKKKTKVYNKTVKKEQKEKEQQQKDSDKLLKNAEKLEGVLQTVVTIGQVVVYTGEALSLIPWTASVGLHMIEVGGQVVQYGNYGIAAVNVLKTGIYAAQGNLMGALASVATAAMAVAAAQSAGDQAAGAQQSLTDMANEGVQQAAQGALQGLAQEGVEDVTQNQLIMIASKGADIVKDETMGVLTELGTKTAFEGLKKQVIKQTLKQVGKDLLLNANSMIQTGSRLFSGGSDDSSKKKKSNYKMSNKVKKIMRKNAKRRKSINKKYG